MFHLCWATDDFSYSFTCFKSRINQHPKYMLPIEVIVLLLPLLLQLLLLPT